MVEALPSVVVVIRAWHDEAGVRGRITLEGDGRDVETVMASSVEELCALACAALERWAERR